MAVFPAARRAVWRSARLPWLVAAAALVLITIGLPDSTLVSGGAGDRVSTIRGIDAGSSSEAPGSMALIETLETTSPWLSDAQRSLLAQTSASDALLAAEEALFYVKPAVATLEETATFTALVSEVSDAPAVVEVVEPEPVAVEPVVAVVTTTVASEEPATEPAPAIEAPAAPPAPVAPVQTVPAAGPIGRWAAAGIIIHTEGQSLDDASLANVDAALSLLPPGVLASLGNPALGPLQILVNTEGRVLSGDQPYGGPANFFSTNEGTNELVLYPNQSVFTIVHELGHAYNLRRVGAGRYAMVLLDQEMRSFLAASGWQINSSEDEIRTAVDHMHVSYVYTGAFHWPRMSNDDPLEDFANSFSMFFLDPGTLHAQSPERYAWMAGLFGN